MAMKANDLLLGTTQQPKEVLDFIGKHILIGGAGINNKTKSV